MTIIKEVANCIERAQANAPFYVQPQFKNKCNVMRIMSPGCVDMCICSLVPNNEAEDMCERLNKDWVAREVLNFITRKISEKVGELYGNNNT